MTWVRARRFVGSALIVFIALSLTGHLLSGTLGIGDAYPFLGPLSEPWVAQLVLAVFLGVGLASIIGLPIGGWLSSFMRAGADTVVAVHERQIVHEIEVSDLPSNVLTEPGRRPHDVLPTSLGGPGTVSLPRPKNAPDDTPAPAPGSKTALPSIDIFNPVPKGPATPLDLQVTARRIQETLASFNVESRVVGYHSGPVITQFDVQPGPGIKVRRITELQNDLALALAAPTIRIQAPVPGKPVVGIEIPNASASMVLIRELLESEEYRKLFSPLRIVIGKDVAGNPTVIDLARMPHLLIAGATGSGKSICLNAIISSLLFQNTPDDVRLMLVDPKMVELAVYNGVPHLLCPVVTQMDKVVGVLQWALREMERRYQLFATNTVRNIQRYNEKMSASGVKKLPYIVVVVDELADLMMISPEDVEDAICRLAQLARAAGIHLVVATQRPSVDVVTGLIKANFPARVAFAMTSQVDSRTILDTIGAEKLLGRGDMLYLPPDAPKPIRLQGALISDTEIERLVQFWQRSGMYGDVSHVSAEELAAAEKAAREATDELLDEATRMVREYQHASVSLLQRRLKIGYARAARLMDQLEDAHVVGPADGAKQRPVLDDDSQSE